MKASIKDGEDFLQAETTDFKVLDKIRSGHLRRAEVTANAAAAHASSDVSTGL